MNFMYRTLLASFVCAGSLLQAASVEDLEAKAKAGEAAGTKAGLVAEAVVPPANPHIATPEEQYQGVVMYRPSMAKWFKGRAPDQEEVGGAWSLANAKGEISSTLLGAYAVSDRSGLVLQARTEGLGKDISVQVLPLIMAPLSQRKKVSAVGVMGDAKGTETFMKAGLWLADNGPVEIKKGEARAWVVRVYVGNKAPSGTLQVPFELTDGGGKVLGKATLNLTVHPFELVDPLDRGYTVGAFCGGADFSEAEFHEMKSHGIESIQWFWHHFFGTKFQDDNGKLKLSFDELDRSIDGYLKAGMRGPLVMGTSGTKGSSFFSAICKAMKTKPDMTDPTAKALLVEGFKQLFDHAAAKKWPEIVVLPIDEPTQKQEKMEIHRWTIALLREHFPKVRIYGVCMDKFKNAKAVSDADILVCNGSFEGIVDLGRKDKKTVWLYGVASAAGGYEHTRVDWGLNRFSYGANGVFFWCYNYLQEDAYNDFDGTRPDSVYLMAWPPLHKEAACVGSPAFEGFRDGVNDVRYALTLEKALQDRTDAKAAKVKAEYENYRATDMRNPATSAAAMRAKLVEWLSQVIQ